MVRCWVREPDDVCVCGAVAKSVALSRSMHFFGYETTFKSNYAPEKSNRAGARYPPDPAKDALGPISSPWGAVVEFGDGKMGELSPHPPHPSNGDEAGGVKRM